MIKKRITVFSGHYGSGKTNVSVNYAISLKKEGKSVSIYDLDIVNPYFRTVDAMERLKSEGVGLIVSPFAETNVDIPAMNSASYKMIDDKSEYAVVDLGGDDRGALALGRFSEGIKEENDYLMVLVVNVFRPETKDLSGLIEIKEEIERVSKIPFNAIVNNSNVGKETTEEDILFGVKKVEEFAKELKLPIVYNCVRADLFDKIKLKIDNALPIELIKYGDWL